MRIRLKEKNFELDDKEVADEGGGADSFLALATGMAEADCVERGATGGEMRGMAERGRGGGWIPFTFAGAGVGTYCVDTNPGTSGGGAGSELGAWAACEPGGLATDLDRPKKLLPANEAFPPPAFFFSCTGATFFAMTRSFFDADATGLAATAFEPESSGAARELFPKRLCKESFDPTPWLCE